MRDANEVVKEIASDWLRSLPFILNPNEALSAMVHIFNRQAGDVVLSRYDNVMVGPVFLIGFNSARLGYYIEFTIEFICEHYEVGMVEVFDYIEEGMCPDDVK